MFKSFKLPSILTNFPPQNKDNSNLNVILCEEKGNETIDQLDEMFAADDPRGMGGPLGPDSVSDRPPQMHMLTQPTKMITTIFEPIEGFKFDLMSMLPNGLNGQYSLMYPSKGKTVNTVSVAVAPGGKGSMVNAQKDSSGKMFFSSLLRIRDLDAKCDIQFQNKDINMSATVFEIIKYFQSSYLAVKRQAMQGEVHYGLTYMQTIYKNFYAGFEATYLSMNPAANPMMAMGGMGDMSKIHYSYVMQIKNLHHNFFATYNPMMMMPGTYPLNFGYMFTHKKIAIATELKTGGISIPQMPAPTSELLLGFRMAFLRGMFTGSVSSNQKLNATLMHIIEPFQLTLQCQYDFLNPQTPSSFGIGINMGLNSGAPM